VIGYIASYLSNRKQQIRYDNHSSKILAVTCGVLQGPILGCLLFISYKNDIVNALYTANLLSFADDMTLFLSHIDIK